MTKRLDFTHGRIRLVSPAVEMFEVWRAAHLGSGPPQSPTNAPPRSSEECTLEQYLKLLEHVDSLRAKGDHGLSILRVSDGAQVGVLSLFDGVDGPSQSIFIGYTLFNQYWGNGYATEAVRAGLSIAFEKLNMHRVEALVELDNLASIRVVERAGFRKEGTSRRRIFQRGEWRDVYVYAFTEEDQTVLLEG